MSVDKSTHLGIRTRFKEGEFLEESQGDGAGDFAVL